MGCLSCQQVCPENVDVELTVAPPKTFDVLETTAILAAAERSELAAATLDKLERCGLDYSPDFIARNLTALLRGSRPFFERSTVRTAGQAGTITVRGSALARRTRPAARSEPQGKEPG